MDEDHKKSKIENIEKKQLKLISKASKVNGSSGRHGKRLVNDILGMPKSWKFDRFAFGIDHAMSYWKYEMRQWILNGILSGTIRIFSIYCQYFDGFQFALNISIEFVKYHFKY